LCALLETLFRELRFYLLEDVRIIIREEPSSYLQKPLLENSISEFIEFSPPFTRQRRHDCG
jgi:hypothetical protein